MIDYPFGEADVQTPAYAANLAVTIKSRLTILEPAILTGDMTINLTIDSKLKPGALLFGVFKATANADDVTLGTGIDGPNIVGVAGKNKSQLYMYDGISFKACGAEVQLD